MFVVHDSLQAFVVPLFLYRGPLELLSTASQAICSESNCLTIHHDGNLIQS